MQAPSGQPSNAPTQAPLSLGNYIITFKEGMPVWENVNSDSTVVSNLAEGTLVHVVEIQQHDGRQWGRIDDPVAGWITLQSEDVRWVRTEPSYAPLVQLAAANTGVDGVDSEDESMNTWLLWLLLMLLLLLCSCCLLIGGFYRRQRKKQRKEHSWIKEHNGELGRDLEQLKVGNSADFHAHPPSDSNPGSCDESGYAMLIEVPVDGSSARMPQPPMAAVRDVGSAAQDVELTAGPRSRPADIEITASPKSSSHSPRRLSSSIGRGQLSRGRSSSPQHLSSTQRGLSEHLDDVQRGSSFSLSRANTSDMQMSPLGRSGTARAGGDPHSLSRRESLTPRRQSSSGLDGGRRGSRASERLMRGTPRMSGTPQSPLEASSGRAGARGRLLKSASSVEQPHPSLPHRMVQGGSDAPGSDDGGGSPRLSDDGGGSPRLSHSSEDLRSSFPLAAGRGQMGRAPLRAANSPPRRLSSTLGGPENEWWKTHSGTIN